MLIILFKVTNFAVVDMQAAEALCIGKNTAILQQRHVAAYRRYITARLLRCNMDETHAVCAKLRDCNSRHDHQWIFCNACMLWFHYECQGLTRKPRKKHYLCIKCVSSAC